MISSTYVGTLTGFQFTIANKSYSVHVYATCTSLVEPVLAKVEHFVTSSVLCQRLMGKNQKPVNVCVTGLILLLSLLFEGFLASLLDREYSRKLQVRHVESHIKVKGKIEMLWSKKQHRCCDKLLLRYTVDLKEMH